MANPDPNQAITILHTNDFHNRLTNEQAVRIRSRTQELKGRYVLLDAGDAVGSGNITYNRAGEAILTTMSDVGYDAMTVGNRDFHFSETGFRAKTMLARFPVLCANIRSKSMAPTDKAALFCDHLVLERNGWRVVVLGLTVPMITDRMMARHVSPYLFDDPILTAKRLVPILREQYRPDLLIALTHIGLHQDRLLADAIPELDLIVGGHSHNLLPEGERVGAVLIVQTGCWARHIGRVIATKALGQSKPVATASVEAL